MVIQGQMPRQRRVMLHDVSLHNAKGIHGGKEEAATETNVTLYRERCQLGLLGPRWAGNNDQTAVDPNM